MLNKLEPNSLTVSERGQSPPDAESRELQQRFEIINNAIRSVRWLMRVITAMISIRPKPLAKQYVGGILWA